MPDGSDPQENMSLNIVQTFTIPTGQMDMKISCLAALNHIQAVDLYDACPSYRRFYNT